MNATFQVLETKRLILSEFQLSDASAVFQYASNPNVAKTTSWHAHNDIASSEAFITFVISRISFESGKVFCPWAIRKKVDEIAVGSISFSQLSINSGRIDYALAEREWNKGLVSEAACAVLAWAFSHISTLETICSSGLSENRSSLRVMEKCGMKLEKVYSVTFEKFNDQEREVSEYSVSRREFEALHPPITTHI